VILKNQIVSAITCVAVITVLPGCVIIKQPEPITVVNPPPIVAPSPDPSVYDEYAVLSSGFSSEYVDDLGDTFGLLGLTSPVDVPQNNNLLAVGELESQCVIGLIRPANPTDPDNVDAVIMSRFDTSTDIYAPDLSPTGMKVFVEYFMNWCAGGKMPPMPDDVTTT
jgi:hypothetical protein